MGSPASYVASLPPGRREAVALVRDLVNANLQPGFEEGTGYSVGMITWSLPGDLSPRTYNRQPLTLAALCNRRHYMTLYLMQLVHDAGERSRFETAWRRTGKRLDLGRSAVRFRTVEDLALDVIAEHIGRSTVDQLIASFELAWARS